MDQEMNFPNPVVRHDLPTRRRRWPRVLLAGAVVVLLIGVFLPQILSSKVGRKFVVAYISSKTNSQGVTLESFKTSWFGPTELHFLNVPDAMNRKVAFKSLTCKATLWRLLRGRYDLGETVVEGLNVDWVVDDGKGMGTWDRLKGEPGRPLPQVSGTFKINGGSLTLHRGTVQKGLYNTTWSQSSLQNLEATIEVRGLDKPIDYTVEADAVEEGGEPGTIKSSGTVAGGDGGLKEVDATLTGENVRTALLGSVLMPGVTAADVREALGPVLDKIDVDVESEGGTFTFKKLEMSGPGARVDLRPVFEMGATPPVVTLAGPGEISLGNCKSLGAEVWVYVNPFAREASGDGGAGRVTVTLEQLRLPLGKRWTKGVTAAGRFKATGVALARKDEMGPADAQPENVASQLAMLTADGRGTAGTALDADGRFTVGGGNVTVANMATTVGETALTLGGQAELEGGNLKMAAAVVKSAALGSLFQAAPGGAVGIPVGGTVRRPVLGVYSLTGELPAGAADRVTERLNAQVVRMRSADAERALQKSQRVVDEMMRPLRGPATQK